jgi:molybdopterin/thiamine biosynthesis adenylyltransferase
MRFSTALTAAVDTELNGHLLRSDGQEDLCFATWRPSQGRERLTAVIENILLPEDGERHVHGNASFEPRYFLRALARAARDGAGLALLHSHPGGTGWQRMSQDDFDAERGHAAQALVATGLPLVGMTLAGDGCWSSRIWRKMDGGHSPGRCESVRVVGQRLRLTYDDHVMPAPAPDGRLVRTVSAWGEQAQADLARLHVGVIGTGSVGSMVAEALARLGIVKITLMDFDSVELHNLDRVLHATRADIGKAKARVLQRGLLSSSTAAVPDIRAYELSVVEDEGFRIALDCDFLFSCVDRPWPRAVLNLIAYAHLVSVVDGGILIEASPCGMRGAHWRAHIAGPGRRCLECLEQYDPGLVQTEREGRLDDSEYIRGLPEDHALRRNENVFPFSMSVASFEVLQFIRMVIAPGGLADVGGDDYQFVLGRHVREYQACREGCWYPTRFIARGDHVGITVTGRHAAAEAARLARADERRLGSPSTLNA